MNHKIDLRPNIKEEPPIVQKIGNRFNVSMKDTIFITDSMHTGITVIQDFNEKNIIATFKMIQEFDHKKNNSKSDLRKKYVEIQKALDEFNRSMESHDKVSKFKHLYNSLELIVNSDGVDRKGDDFDKEAYTGPQIDTQDICKWRNYYNRFKHTSRNDNDIHMYENAIADLSKILPSIRQACKKIILMKI